MESAFLADASATLAASLEPGVILDRLVHLALATHADFCTVDLVDSSGTLVRSHGAHSGHDQVELVQRYLHTGGELPSGHPVRRAVLSGTSLLFPAVSPEALVRSSTHPEQRKLVEELAPQSMIVVPLAARGRVLGALALFSSRADFRYGTADLAVAEELGRRAALALDNARLYREAQAAEARTQEHLGRIKSLAEASRLFVEAGLDVPGITHAVARSVAILGDLCLLRLVGEDGLTLRPAGFLAGNDSALRKGERERFFAEAAVDATVGLYADVLLHGRPVRTEREQLATLCDPDRSLLTSFDVGPVLVIPLHLRDQPLGVLAVARPRGGAAFSVDDQIFAEDVCHRASLALQNARLYTQAQEASRLRDEFFATLSHELRTPLTAILGWTQMLKTGRHGPSALPRALAVIERNARAQARLVEDLLDVSRILNGKLQLELREIDLLAPIEAAVEALRPTATAKQIRLETDFDARAGKVLGDSARLQQVFWNLISNAVKFTPVNGSVEVKVASIGDEAELIVSDTGEGIAPEFAPHVFERFRQADGSTTRRHGGLGLGLSIVRNLVEQHGGSVRVESAGLGHGSRFIVRIPRLRPAPEAEGLLAAADGLAHEPSIQGLKILLVDDEADSLEIVTQLLRRRGATVTARTSVNEALTALRQASQPFDVLVSDIGMPGQDGYALVRQLRSFDQADVRGLPAVALTAYARAEDRARAISEGFQIHVPKPVDPLELATVVANLVRASRP